MLSTRPASKAILAWGTLLLWGSNAIAPAVAFAPSCGTASPATISSSKQWQVSQLRKPSKAAAQHTLTALFQSNNNDDEPITDNQLLQRFLSPRIDDNGLPLTDVLIAQIVAPTFQTYWLALTHAPNPTWARPISTYFGEALELAPRGSLLAPTLIHGAGLAVCWLAGALAAKSFEKEAFILKEVEGRGMLDAFGRWDTILLRLFQAGAFASGILIVSTQTDLLL